MLVLFALLSNAVVVLTSPLVLRGCSPAPIQDVVIPVEELEARQGFCGTYCPVRCVCLFVCCPWFVGKRFEAVDFPSRSAVGPPSESS